MSLLNAQQLERVSHAVQDLTPAQLAWVGGYLSGLSLGGDNVIPFPQAMQASAPGQQNAPTTTILYGSQTGNSKHVAQQLEQELKAAGTTVSLKSLRDYRPQQLKKEQRIVAVISTHGNGEPPDDARAFFQFLNSTRAPKLAGLEFAVLALGDSSYEEFCQTGRELDQRLAQLGASRWLERLDCDVDFTEEAARWRQQLLDKVGKDSFLPGNNPIRFKQQPTGQAISQAPGTREAPYPAELLALTPVTDAASDKEVLHAEFSLGDSGISYQPGDILALEISNDAALVEALLARAGLDGDTEIILKGKALRLRTALQERLEITSLTRRQYDRYLELTGLSVAAAPDIPAYHEAADWLDVLEQLPQTLDAQTLVELLRPLKAREYSIASSLEAHPEEVHLLVKRVDYPHNGRRHLGAGSNWLARLQAGENARIYIKPNTHFKLPADDSTRIIMIGAGTGVAPFRSFIAERESRGVQGGSWLFFGEQHFRTDFLYQAEWLQYLQSGALERMSVAFSRDQAEKVYVQHRLLEQAADLWDWLQQGAQVYVCGDMHKMAKDVHQALTQIMVQQGGMTTEQAEAGLEQLIADGRYQRDVY
ncbi:MAG TPA: assimilatory sulfite reductase (NADPH) flavoprotein subunit [Thiolinea sp.]|nr:assimilatory sulfite reductase (NADPH) flavoprotein subunit [Thiolinea sp.]